METLSFYRPFILKNRFACSIAIVFGVLNSFITLLLPLSLGRFYELVFHGSSNKGQILNSLGLRLGESFFSFSLIFLVLIIAKGIFEYLFTYTQESIVEKFVAQLRLRVFSNHLHSDFALHQRKPTGKYLNRYVSDFGNIRRGFSVGLITFISDIIFSVFAFVILIAVNPILTTVLIIGFSLNIIGLSLIEQKQRKLLLDKQNNKSAYINFIFDRLGAFLSIKAFSREKVEKKRFEVKMDAYKISNLNYLKAKSLERAIIQFGVYFTIFLILLAVYFLTSASKLSFEIGQLISFILLIFALKPLIRRFLKVDNFHKNAIISIQRIKETDIEQITQLNELKFHTGYITFHHVGFGYDEQKAIIYDLSFDAKKGAITRLLGRSGSGKTTIFRLISKLQKPQKGVIYIDGQDISMISGIMKYISIISDEIPLLGKNVFEVVSESKNEVNRRRAINSLNKLNCVFNLPHSVYLERKIENNGANLSLIERKILNIARGIVSEKPILLIDEPFAGLDEKMTCNLGEFFNTIKANKTIIIISSRACESIEYDKIVDLEVDSWKKMVTSNKLKLQLQ